MEHLELPLNPENILWDKGSVRKGGCSHRLLTGTDSKGENGNFWVRRLCPSPVCPCHPKARGFTGSGSLAVKPLPWEVMSLGLKLAVKAFGIRAGRGLCGGLGSSVLAHPAGWEQAGSPSFHRPGGVDGHSHLLCPPCFGKMPFRGEFGVKLIPSRGARS